VPGAEEPQGGVVAKRPKPIREPLPSGSAIRFAMSYAIAHGLAALVSFSPRIRERHGRVAAERHALSFATNASRFEMPCN
jgi:hypothetical protein